MRGHVLGASPGTGDLPQPAIADHYDAVLSGNRSQWASLREDSLRPRPRPRPRLREEAKLVTRKRLLIAFEAQPDFNLLIMLPVTALLWYARKIRKCVRTNVRTRLRTAALSKVCVRTCLRTCLRTCDCRT
ncbi:hypothetical protein SAMN05216229_106117 [Geopseudomonas sagittaria]|uniref:Uncharacterized protein n=1 Tax=Geopseudomonas sagittaria TaxID=1135990 RepID=A0A1I5TJ85_9GAMM|nr:hypothetical protein SAMN05216229_106117 [Pseudomonas sagittaria]